MRFANVDADAPLAQFRRDDRRRLARALVDLPLPVEQERGWNHAEVTAGGVPLNEVSWRTMSSKLTPGLHLAGEVLDIDGRIGGFNFQWAWATGHLAGRARRRRVCFDAMTALAAPPRKLPASPPARPRNGAEFLDSLGGVPIERVIFDPPPGTVTGEFYDSIGGEWNGMLVELVNATLVEKAMGMDESRIGMNFGTALNNHVRREKLGFVAGEAGTVKMVGGNRRMPDVAVYLKADYPGGVRPKEKVPLIPPRLIVEVLSADNTAAEVDMKLRELFASGCRLAYVIDPRTRTARRHASADDFTTVDEGGTLDGGDVLPGFAARLADLFDEEIG